jgi:hypothetical protein
MPKTLKIAMSGDWLLMTIPLLGIALDTGQQRHQVPLGRVQSNKKIDMRRVKEATRITVKRQHNEMRDRQIIAVHRHTRPDLSQASDETISGGWWKHTALR